MDRHRQRMTVRTEHGFSMKQCEEIYTHRDNLKMSQLSLQTNSVSFGFINQQISSKLKCEKHACVPRMFK